jgi:hypothetical protein
MHKHKHKHKHAHPHARKHKHKHKHAPAHSHTRANTQANTSVTWHAAEDCETVQGGKETYGFMAIISLITSALGPESGTAGCRCGPLDDPQSASAPTSSPLRKDWAHPSNICNRTGLTPATSAP